MKFKLTFVIIFFAVIALAAGLLFPTSLDVVTIYRNSFLYGKALEQLDALGHQREGDPRVDLARARVLYMSGRYDPAIAVLAQVTQYDPQNRQAWWRLAEVYRTVQLPVEAIAALEQVVVIAPADSQALYLLDDYYRWFQLTDKAVATLDAIVDLFPSDYNSFERLVDLHLRTGDSDAAARVLRRMATIFPDREGALEDLAFVYLSQRDGRAVALFEELYAKNPDRDNIADDLLQALTVAGASQRALSVLAEHYEPRLEPGPYQARLAQLHWNLGDPGEAIEAFERAEALTPDITHREALVDLYGSVEQFDDAADMAHRLVEEWPDHPRYWEQWTDFLAAATRKQELVTALQRYVGRWPKDPDGWLELADAYQWVEDLAAERTSVDRLLQLRPGETKHLQRRARILADLGDHRAAAAQYMELLKEEPECEPCFDGLLGASEQLMPGGEPTRQAAMLWRLRPGHRAAGLLHARRLDEMGMGESADAVYAQLAGEMADPVSLADLGQRILAADRPEAARPYFAASLAGDPEQPTALSGLASIAAGNSPDTALKLLGRLQQLSPTDPDVVYRMGLAHEALKDTVAMVEAYTTVMRLAPRHDGSVYGMRRQAHAMQRLGKEQSAIALLDSAITRHPQALSLVNDYAEILILRGQHTAALRRLAQIGLP